MEILTDQILQLILVNIPNFAGFVMLSIMLYRTNMALLEQNRDLVRRLDECSESIKESKA